MDPKANGQYFEVGTGHFNSLKLLIPFSQRPKGTHLWLNKLGYCLLQKERMPTTWTHGILGRGCKKELVLGHFGESSGKGDLFWIWLIL